MKLWMYLPAAALMAGTAVPASAATISLGSTGNWTGAPGYFTFDQTFDLPTNAVNIVLSITNFTVDDRGILSLNGTAVDSTGIFASAGSTGSFNFGQSAPTVSYTFAGAPGTRNVSVTSGFNVGGSNLFSFIANDTNNGIYGDVLGTAANASYSFAANVSFDLAGSGVPEPATWGLMILGMGSVGAALRRRKTSGSLRTA